MPERWQKLGRKKDEVAKNVRGSRKKARKWQIGAKTWQKGGRGS